MEYNTGKGRDDPVKTFLLIMQNREIRKKFLYLVVCFVSIVAIALAWFFYDKEAQTDNMEMVSIEAVDLGISFSDEDFSSKIEIPYMSNLCFEPVSGNGKENKMYIPILPIGEGDASKAIGWYEAVYDENADKNSFYFTDIYFCCDKPGYVMLSSIDVSPAAAAKDRSSSDYTDKNGATVTSSGETTRPVVNSPLYTIISGIPIITKDYIAGAARVGIVNLSNDDSSKAVQNAIIIPNDTYTLSVAVANGICSVYMNEQGPSVSTGSYYDGSEIRDYVKEKEETEEPENTENTENEEPVEETEDEAEDLNVFTESGIKSGDELPVLELVDNGDGTYRGHITLALWIEGFDNEANEILGDGMIKSEIKFAYSKTVTEKEEQTEQEPEQE